MNKNDEQLKKIMRITSKDGCLILAEQLLSAIAAVRLYFDIAVGALELPVQPLLKAHVVECVAAAGDHPNFLSFRKV